MTIQISYRSPMRLEAAFAFLAKRATPGVEIVEDSSWKRAVRCDDRDVIVTASANGRAIHLDVANGDARDAHHIAARVRRTFDVGTDAEAIAAGLSKDRRLRPLVKKFAGTRVPNAWEPFETAVRAIVGQQVSVAAATTIMGRIARAHGTATADGSLLYFPAPDKLSNADLSTMGLPRARAAAINALASAATEDVTLLEPVTTLEEAVAKLCAIRGIGPWTAQYIAMRAIGHPDAFPVGDLGLVKAAAAIGIEKNDLDKAAERWRPWRAYAAMILWESLS